MKKQVLNVGQCSLDDNSIGKMLNANFDVHIANVSSHDETMKLAQEGKFDLILINRIYDADQSAGQNTIEALCAMESSCPVMLVSNYEDAQQSAINAGAVKGFGKSQLGAAETIELLKKHLA